PPMSITTSFNLCAFAPHIPSSSIYILPRLFTMFFFQCYPAHRDLHSFPTRRSSDLHRRRPVRLRRLRASAGTHRACTRTRPARTDRKSTRLNSSHVKISYAVFCLKKKNKKKSRNINNEKEQS